MKNNEKIIHISMEISISYLYINGEWESFMQQGSCGLCFDVLNLQL